MDRKPYADDPVASLMKKRGRGRPKGTKNPNGGRPRKEKIIAKKLAEGAVTQSLQNNIIRNADKLVQAVIQEEGRIAFSDIRFLPGCPDGIPDEIAYAVKSFKVREDVLRTLDTGDQLIRRTTEFALWDKGAALQRLSQQLGLYAADNKQKSEANKSPVINLYLEQGDVNMTPKISSGVANGHSDL